MFGSEFLDDCEGTPRAEVLECWPEFREFMPVACCEEHQVDLMDWLDMVQRDRPGGHWARGFAQWFRDETGLPARGLAPGPMAMHLDWMLWLDTVPQKEAFQFIRQHHRHHQKPPAGWRWGHAVRNGPDLVGVASVGSMLYAAAAREAKRRGFAHIITYVLETEDATTLRAAGWQVEARVRGRSWNTRSRPREDTAPTCPKVRWGKELKG